MTRIFGQQRDFQESAVEVLSLILCARRPLTSRELQHALMIETGDKELDLDNSLDPETMLSVCAGLITIDESSDTIRFVHYTTQEYLQRTQDRWLPGAKLKITRACLDYLLLQEFALASRETTEDTGPVRKDASSANLTNGTVKVYGFAAEPVPGNIARDVERTKLEFPFADYAIKHGPYHWDAAVQTESSTHADILSLLKNYQILSVMHQVLYSNCYLDAFVSGPKLDAVVNWISELGLADLTEFCLVKGLARDTKGTPADLDP